MNEYKCKDCNATFKTEEKQCPKCGSLNIEKVIPLFFGITQPPVNDACEGGVCSFDKK